MSVWNGPDPSSRERSVLSLFADGHTIREVAAQLAYSERTVKNIMDGIRERHGLRNRTHAVATAIRREWI